MCCIMNNYYAYLKFILNKVTSLNPGSNRGSAYEHPWKPDEILFRIIDMGISIC